MRKSLEKKYTTLSAKINDIFEEEKRMCYLTLTEDGHVGEILNLRMQREALEDERSAVLRKINHNIIVRVRKAVRR